MAVDGQAVADAVADTIEAVGMPATLRRIVSAGTFLDAAVCAVRRGAGAAEGPGGVTQHDTDIRISNREIAAAAWPGPPRRGDRIVVAGQTFTVEAVDILDVSGVAAEFVLKVRGV